MNRRALLGLYTIFSILGLLGLFAVLSDLSTKLHGYRIGVRFPSAAGLHPGGLVYESGVIVGTVDDVSVLPDYSTEVILALRSSVEVPSDASFLILQPLTGDPTLRIYPKSTHPASPPLPHRILPVAQQPYGQASLSLAEFLARSQDQFANVNGLLQQLQSRGPGFFRELEHTLQNANTLMVTANQSTMLLSADAHRSLASFSDSSTNLTNQLSQSLAMASADILAATARLNESSKAGQPHLDHILRELDLASSSFAKSVDSLHAIAADPALHENAVKSSRSLAETAATFAALLADLRKVSGSETTQAELRDAVAHLDSASQKADSFMGKFGHSHVPGVDYSVTPPSRPSAANDSAQSGSLSERSLGPAEQSDNHADAPEHSHHGMNDNASARLFQFDVRASELSPLHRTANAYPLNSPLLSADRGPQTDLSVVLLPDGSTSYLVGANDLGGTAPTFSLANIHHSGMLTYGGGILYSRLGVLSGVQVGPVGINANLYDPRRGSLDVYGNLNATKNTTIFAGERDATRATRRNVYGVDVHF